MTFINIFPRVLFDIPGVCNNKLIYVITQPKGKKQGMLFLASILFEALKDFVLKTN